MRALRLALPVLAAHLGGTLLTFLMLPGLMFPKATRCSWQRTASS